MDSIREQSRTEYVICDACGMRYIPKCDRRRHERVHDERLNGVPWKPHRAEQVVGRFEQLRVVHVDYSRPKSLRKLAWKVGSSANIETRFDFGVYAPYWSDNEALIGVMDDRAVAMLVTQPMGAVWRLTWEQYDKEIEPQDIPEAAGRRGCGFLWALKRHRGTGIARVMADVAVAQSGRPKEDFPWLYPFTDLGERFIRRYCPQQFAAARL